MLRRYYEVLRRKRDMAGQKLEAAYGRMSASYYLDCWRNSVRAVNAGVEDLGEAFFRIRKGDRWTFVQRHWVMLDDCLSRNLVNNKSLIHQIGASCGWRSPRHRVYDYLNVQKAHRFMEELEREVVIKPRTASRGNGITTRIRHLGGLREATALAASYDRTLLVEEFVEGDNYRLLFLDGDYAGAVRREPPGVTGDGSRSVRGLVQNENERRLRAAPATSLIPLHIDLECKRTLKRQGLTPGSVPKKGDRIRLKSVINQNAASENHTFTDRVHSSIVDMGRKVASVLNLKLFGMDLITRDMGVPLKRSGGVVNEIHTQPGLHYHDLVSDESGKLPVGELVLQSIFTRSDQRLCG